MEVVQSEAVVILSDEEVTQCPPVCVTEKDSVGERQHGVSQTHHRASRREKQHNVSLTLTLAHSLWYVSEA